MNDTQRSITDLEPLLSFRNYRNYRSVINTLNKSRDWDLEVIYVDRMIFHWEELMNDLAPWKLRMIRAALKKLGYTDPLPLTDEINKPIETIPWIELHPKLVELAQRNKGIAGRIAMIFSYGMILDIGQILTTVIDRDDLKSNFLDLKECKWYIRNIRSGTERIYDVPEELCEKLTPVVPRKYLICKRDGSPYQSRLLSSYGWSETGLPNNRAIRKSFEEHDTERTVDSVSWHPFLGQIKVQIKVKPNTLSYILKKRKKDKSKCNGRTNLRTSETKTNQADNDVQVN